MIVKMIRPSAQLWNVALADPRVVRIFDFWKLLNDHPRSRLDKNRHDTIYSFLELGYEEDDICCAIEGNYAYWAQQDGIKYDNLESHILISPAKLDWFINIGEAVRKKIEQQEKKKEATPLPVEDWKPPTPEEIERKRKMIADAKLKINGKVHA